MQIAAKVQELVQLAFIVLRFNMHRSFFLSYLGSLGMLLVRYVRVIQKSYNKLITIFTKINSYTLSFLTVKVEKQPSVTVFI